MQKQIYTKEEMQKHIDALPPEIKSLLYSTEVEMIIQKVGLDNKLHLDQVSMLMAVTNEVMTGFIDTQDFPQTLMTSLDVDKIKADAIAKDIDALLFVKIREAMKKVYAQAIAAPVVPMTQPAAVKTVPIMDQKSVVMPSSIAAKPASAPVSSVLPPKTPVTPAAPIAPTSSQIAAPDTHLDTMLSQPTISVPKKVDVPVAPTPVAPKPASAAATVPSVTTKVEPPKPAPIYKADPYREPIE